MFASSLFRPATVRSLAGYVELAAILALLFAFTSQYYFGLKPCHLCLWQRVPYAAIIVLCWLARLWRALPWRAFWLLALVLIAVEIGIAGYHSALERHLVSGPTECSGGIEAGMDVDALRARILGAAVTRCDEPVWMLPGISMANGNLIFALLLFGYTFIQGRRFLVTKETT